MELGVSLRFFLVAVRLFFGVTYANDAPLDLDFT